MAARITLDELTQEPEYVRLTTKQQNFVRTYLQGFLDAKTLDSTAAAMAAYACTNRESARTHGAHLLSNFKIAQCLDKYFGTSLESSFTHTLLKAINNPRLTVAQKDALELFAKIHGWADGLPSVKEAQQSQPAPSKHTLNRRAKVEEKEREREKQDAKECARVNHEFGFGA